MTLSEILVFICLLQGAKQIKAETDWRLTFECDEGWILIETFCFKYEDFALTYKEAYEVCDHKGSAIFSTVYSYDKVSMYWPQEIWFYSEWDFLNNNAIPWSNGEPNRAVGQYASISKDENVALNDGIKKLPFVCQYRSCQKGYKRCDYTCIRPDKICDGRPDCQDESDENNCSEYGTSYTSTTSETGSFATGRISDNMNKRWTIEVPVKNRIRLYIPSFTLQQNIASLEIRSGSPISWKSTLIERLTGTFGGHYVYSINNYVIVSLRTQGFIGQVQGFTITWTTDIHDIPSDGPSPLEASNSLKSQKIPFSKEPNPPIDLVLNWVITAQQGKYITYYVEISPMDGYKEEDVDFAIFADDMPILYRHYYVSSTNEVNIRSDYVPVNGEVVLKYRIGCGLSISKPYGYVHSPRPLIPNSLLCSWILDGGSIEGRGMTIRFSDLDLVEDPRTGVDNPSRDMFMIDVYGGNGPIVDVTEYESVEDIIIAPEGKANVTFQSDVVLQSGEFTFMFATDCEKLDLSEETQMNVNTSYTDETVLLSCPPGHRFNQEKFMNYESIEVVCKPEGWFEKYEEWDCIPECQIVYCGTPDKITDGAVIRTTGVEYQSVATYECNLGFTMTGDENATCDENGNWTGVPECLSANNCPPLSDDIVENGMFDIVAGIYTQSQASFGTVIKFSCDDGFEIVGPVISRCTIDGWTIGDTPPTCKRLPCPVYPVPHSDMTPASVDNPVVFGDTLSVECDLGYKFVNRDDGQVVTIQCLANKTFDEMLVCEDIDECVETPEVCDNVSTTCMNMAGSVECKCKDGFVPHQSDPSLCIDIEECSDDNGGCDDECVETEPFYECRCNSPGYVLYTEDGLHGFSLPESETGLMKEDMYHIGHTCVPMLCPSLNDVDNGVYLMNDLENFHVGDSVTLHCNDGYSVDGMGDDVTEVELKCSETLETWESLYTCVKRNCSLPGGEKVSFGDTYELPCTLAYQKSVTYSATCVYQNGDMTFIGENIEACPEIDCGDPENSPVWPDGGAFLNGVKPSTTTFDGTDSYFEFDCQPGFDLSGNSGHSNSTVTCTADGYWNFNTLSCIGKKCSDPGTPGDAVQIADKYEVDSVLSFTCTRPGFKINGPANYTCEYDSGSNSVSWSADLENQLPECMDVTAPTIEPAKTTCGSEILYEAMDMLSFGSISIDDNYAIKSHESSIKSISEFGYINSNMTYDVEVVDFQGNNAKCGIDFIVIDRSIKPDLSCVDAEIQVDNRTQALVNFGDYITISGGDYKVEPASFQYNHNDIGSALPVHVTAANGYDTESYCSFMINFVAGACFEEELFMDPNAQRSCNVNGDNELICESTCATGYIYYDGTSSKNFTCTGTGEWGLEKPNYRYCLAETYPNYEVVVSIDHLYEGFTVNCADEYTDSLDTALSTFADDISELCNGMIWDLTRQSSDHSQVSNEFVAKLKLTLINIGQSGMSPEACLKLIQEHNSLFDMGRLTCDGSSGAVTQKSLVMDDPTLTCINEANYQLTRNNETVCVPYGPGEYYNAASDSAIMCGENEYQDEFGETSCKSCAGKASDDRTHCIDVCPEGFASVSGSIPCTPCAENEYWANITSCVPCPTGYSTLGRQAVKSMDECYEPCPLGCYSPSGYSVPGVGCTHCPANFYQDQTGQTTCKRCATGTEFNGQQAIDVDNCTAINESVCDSNCDHGLCEFQYNKDVCICDEGYYGEFCDQIYHPCDGNPCKNNAECVPQNDFAYECICNTDFDECIMEEINNTHTGEVIDSVLLEFRSVANKATCKQRCVNNPDCVEASFVALSSSSASCSLYNRTLADDELIVTSGAQTQIHMRKECVIGFDGTHCENDIKNECDNAGCHEDSKCKDMINGFECICPSSGSYSGALCDVTTNPCNPNPCTRGTCTAYGSVSYTCKCNNGYVGFNCDIDEDYCESHPNICGYGGMCEDRPPGAATPYRCICADGFSGTYCQNVPDFCNNHDCDGNNVCYNSLDVMGGVCSCDQQYFVPELRCTMIMMQNESALEENENIVDVFTRQASNPMTPEECEGTCQYNSACIYAVLITLPSEQTACYLYNASYEGVEKEGAIAFYKDCSQPGPAYGCERTSLPCDSVTCNNGTCMDSGNKMSYICDCEEGFTGGNCQYNIDDCADNPCQNDGACSDLHLGYECDCPIGFDGDNCENDLDFCPGNCTSNTTDCVEIIDGYRCECKSGFAGRYCEMELDECASFPCQHDGACLDEVDGYTCTCTPGWEGDDCETMVNHCNDINCANGGQCFNLPDSAFCRCEGGAVGEFCENGTKMCDVMANVDVCINRGTCYNTDGTAECKCPITHDTSRCFMSEGMQDVGGGSGNQYLVLFETQGQSITHEVCIDLCMNDIKCYAVQFSSINSKGACYFFEEDEYEYIEDKISVLFTRTCPIDYVGPSCDMVKDWCSDSPCENGGECVCSNPIGYKCLCEPGYYGVNCQHVEDPCDSNPCKGLAVCKSTPTQYICQCSMGKTWTGSKCQDIDEDYIILMNTYMYQESLMLKSSYNLETTELSMMMKFRIHSYSYDACLFAIVGSPELHPSIQAASFVLKITPTDILVLFDDQVVGDIIFAEEYDYQVHDNQWHHLGVSIDRDGTLSATLDGVTVLNPIYTKRNFSLQYNGQHYLGEGVIAEFQDVTVWNRLLSSRDFTDAWQNQFTPNFQPIQAWCNYQLTNAATVIDDSFSDIIYGDPSSVNLELNCPVFDDYQFVLTDRFISRSDVDVFSDFYSGIKNNSDWKFSHNVPEVLTHDVYRVSVEAKDEMTGNFGICRWKILVAYNDTCPAVEIPDSVNATFCDSDRGEICSYSCYNDGKALPAFLPKRLNCKPTKRWGMDDDLFSTPIIPSCEAAFDPEFKFTATMRYQGVAPCKDVFKENIINSLKNQINEQFTDLNNEWDNICIINGNDNPCDNLDISESACDGGENSEIFILAVSVQLGSKEISYVNGGTMPVIDALRSIFLLDQSVHIRNFAEVKLLVESFNVEVDVVCQTGYMYTEEVCVPCSAGWFLNEETNICEPCGYGTYQSMVGQTMCDTCDESSYTYAKGAKSASDCKAKCLKGTIYDEEMDDCIPCERHYYQDRDGMYYCLPCDAGFKTVLNGSDDKLDCKADCDAGKVRDVDSDDCLPCSRGFWRTLSYDDCQPCPEGKTTSKIVLGISEDSCSLDICEQGTYLLDGECTNCPVDYYSDDEFPDVDTECRHCNNCPSCSYLVGTEQEGSNSSQCQRYCAPGKYLDDTGECSLCPRGTYKDESMKFSELCEPCKDSTTEYEGSTDAANCSIPVCTAGEYIFEGSCFDCPFDTFSEVDEPNSEVECIPCSECDLCTEYGTEFEKTDNRSLCFPSCPGGQYYDGNTDSCEYCPVGEYKPESDRFLTFCHKCNDTVPGFVTNEVGALSDAECTLRDCPMGSYIVDEDCELCPEGEYQNETRKDFCYICGTNLNTNGPGHTSVGDCQINCGPGLHGTEECVPCKDGFFKELEGFDDCTKCEIDRTSNEAHTACDVVFCYYGKQFKEGNCEECDEGFFKDQLGNDQMCAQCDPGTTTDGAGQANCSKPFCVPGEFLYMDECVPCLTGSFKEDHGNEECTPCDKGYTTADMGSDSESNCSIVVCPAGQFREPDQTDDCTSCGYNQYQPEEGQTSCLNCTDNKITMDIGQMSEDACVPECQAGFSFNDTTATCGMCPSGTFKPSVGNMEGCANCPIDKTTIGPGKTSLDDCSQDVCNPGTYYVVLDDVASCVPCARGSYTDKTNENVCTMCPLGNTTRYAGSTSEDDCIDDCPAGYGFSNERNECYGCPPGQYNDKTGSNPTKCKRCPEGTTNTVSASETCNFPDDTTIVENNVEVSILLTFGIQIDSCDDSSAVEINMDSITFLIKSLFSEMQSSQFNDDLSFCTDGCENIVSTFSDCQLNDQSFHEITLEVVFQQISDFVLDTSDNGVALPTLDVILEILILHSDALFDPMKDIVFVDFMAARYIDLCQPGQKLENDQCVACEPGFFGIDSTTCQPCPLNEYQSDEGQTTCDQCPDNTYTEDTSSTSLDDCIEICQPGNYYVPDNKTCEPCEVGTYKVLAGNEDGCVSCAADKTTLGTGATSEAECSENVCLAGQYYERDASNVVQCFDCPIGKYNGDTMAVECDDCPGGSTTVLTGSTRIDLCVVICDPGFGINFSAQRCDPCPVGFFNDKTNSNPNMCKKCRPGFYTTQSGQSNCIEDPQVTEAPGLLVSVRITVTFDVALESCSDANTLSRIRTSISIQIRVVLQSRSGRFVSGSSFCEDDCINVSVDFSVNTNTVKQCQAKSAGRRKRALSHELSLDVVVNNVPETVNDGTDDLPTAEVLSQILSSDNLDVNENIVHTGTGAPVVVPVCGNGQQISADTCEPCPAGYYSDDDTDCKSCPADTYQNETGQMSCKECPPLTLNDDFASTQAGACRGFCVLNPLYCNNRGDCSETDRRAASCACDDGYTGMRCEHRTEPESSLDVILGAAIGGGGALLIIILIIIGCWKYMSNNDTKRSKKHLYDPEYVTNGIYDNAGLHPQMAPYRSVGYPALGYRPDTSFEAGSQMDPYRFERPSVHGGDDHGDQPQFMWKA